MPMYMLNIFRLYELLTGTGNPLVRSYAIDYLYSSTITRLIMKRVFSRSPVQRPLREYPKNCLFKKVGILILFILISQNIGYILSSGSLHYSNGLLNMVDRKRTTIVILFFSLLQYIPLFSKTVLNTDSKYITFIKIKLLFT